MTRASKLRKGKQIATRPRDGDNGSRMATRAALMAKMLDDEEDCPLTPDEFHRRRREQEARDREVLRQMREEAAEHERQCRRIR